MGSIVKNSGSKRLGGSPSKGFTLIEVLLTLALVSIVSFGLISLIAGFSRYYNMKRQRLTAEELLNKRIAILMNTDWNSLSSGSATAGPNGMYTITWDVVKENDLLARIKVTVSWIDPRGHAQEIMGYIERYRYLNNSAGVSTTTTSNPYGSQALSPESN